MSKGTLKILPGKEWCDAVTITKKEYAALKPGDILWYKHPSAWREQKDGVVWRKVKVISNRPQSSTLRNLRLEDEITKEIYTISQSGTHLLSLQEVKY